MRIYLKNLSKKCKLKYFDLQKKNNLIFFLFDEFLYACIEKKKNKNTVDKNLIIIFSKFQFF